MKNRRVVSVVAALVLAIALLTGAYALNSKNKNGLDPYDVVFFGDSIVAGDRALWTLTYKLADHGYTVLNGALGGMQLSYFSGKQYIGNSDNLFTMVGLSESVKERDFSLQYVAPYTSDVYEDNKNIVAANLSRVNWDNAKYILIEHGANDYLNGVALDNPNDKYDPYTYGGALRTSIENIRVGAPKAKIIIVTPIYMNPAGLPGDCFEVDYGGGFLADYVNKEKEIAEEYGIYVIDNFTEVPINKDNYDIYIPGGLHGSLEGNELIAANIAKHLKELDELN